MNQRSLVEKRKTGLLEVCVVVECLAYTYQPLSYKYSVYSTLEKKSSSLTCKNFFVFVYCLFKITRLMYTCTPSEHLQVLYRYM